MIKKRFIFIPLSVLIVGALVLGVIAYVMYLRSADETELIFAATEVGTPVGDKITKDIGPAGGTLVSPDGRMTLTVPPSALTKTIAFSIQPITNKAEGGLGLAYRLEPDGATFPTPLELSLRYDDKDLEGTAPEQLTLTYQDKERKWRELKAEKLDEDAKTFTFSTTHFTDTSAFAKIKIVPATATLRVGESLKLEVTGCRKEVEGWDYKVRKFFGYDNRNCHIGYETNMPFAWTVDVGTLTGGRVNPVLYTAPVKKPSPNIATVSIPYETGHNGKTGNFVAHITIVDRGYTASGTDGQTTYSGTVCSLDKEFTLIGHNGPGVFTYKFTPSGDGRAGTGALAGGVSIATLAGGGPYTIEGFDSEKPKIVWDTQYLWVNGKAGGGTYHIDLVPLDGNECGGG